MLKFCCEKLDDLDFQTCLFLNAILLRKETNVYERRHIVDFQRDFQRVESPVEFGLGFDAFTVAMMG